MLGHRSRISIIRSSVCLAIQWMASVHKCLTMVRWAGGRQVGGGGGCFAWSKSQAISGGTPAADKGPVGGPRGRRAPIAARVRGFVGGSTGRAFALRERVVVAAGAGRGRAEGSGRERRKRHLLCRPLAPAGKVARVAARVAARMAARAAARMAAREGDREMRYACGRAEACINTREEPRITSYGR
jgi:hypothetical protein